MQQVALTKILAMRCAFALLFLIFSPIYAFSQQSGLSVKLNWGNERISVSPGPEAKQNILYFEGAVNDPGYYHLPFYTLQLPAEAGLSYRVRISDAVYSPLDHDELIPREAAIGKDLDYDFYIGRKRGESRLQFRLLPLRRGAGNRFEKLESFTLHIEADPSQERALSRRSLAFKSNSVLAGGEWHKIAVRQSGVYRIDRQFLESKLGWDMSGVDPRNIRIYGNGGGMLPEALIYAFKDDLEEIAVKRVGADDGSFDASDYLLFYGEGPTQLLIDSSAGAPRLVHQPHLYDSLTYYFITKDLGPGKSMQMQGSEGSPNFQSSGYDFYLFHEVDKDNLTNSGRQFHGEIFDFITRERNFDFDLSGIIPGSPVNVRATVASRSLVGNTAFRMKANGQNAGSVTLSKVAAEYWAIYANGGEIKTTLTPAPGTLNIQISYQPNGADADSRGWLDFIAVSGRKKGTLSKAQEFFLDLESFGPGKISAFAIEAPASAQIWDVSDHKNVKIQESNYFNGKHSFTLQSGQLRTLLAFDGSAYFSPKYIGSVSNQNIHGNIEQPDMLIIAYSDFMSEAQRLADFHIQRDQMNVKVLDIQKIYNEFSGGAQDITAIRNLMKMLYERGMNGGNPPRYLLLFGDASFDYKNLEIPAASNTNFVPTYQSYETLNRSSTFASDDYFGLLDDNEGQNIVTGGQLMDIGIGRIPADSPEEARDIVNKILHYHDAASYGSWRNTLTFIADDEDSNLHLRQSERLSDTLRKHHPVYNIDKIYLDAYEQTSTPGGNRYPGVEDAINSRIYSGTLIMNYTGHGGEGGLAHERIMTHDMIRAWENYDRLPLLITATCSFARYDNPNTETAGELVLANPQGGAVALISTVRLVYASANYTLNHALLLELFTKNNGKYPRMGDVIMKTKNRIGTKENNRKFALLGDPAMRLGYPQLNVKSTAINQKPFVQNSDTVSALQKVSIQGEVRLADGNIASNFNGIVYPSLFDKAVDVKTLRNDIGSRKTTFKLQKNLLYKGKASVKNGKFSYTFIIPKDINYEFGSGKLSYYASEGSLDGNGYDYLIVGGSADSFAQDNKGPEVKIYMNDENFVSGGMTNASPVMLVKLADENGINTAGNAIGHNITGILDEADENQIILNEFYESELDDFTRGEAKYPLTNLEPGLHKIEVTAWDVYNNSGKGYTEFVVAENARLALDHVLNYPNPFTTSTEFWFEHNKPGQTLSLKIEIYTVTGRLIKTLRQEFNSEGFQVRGIQWDGRDEYGDEIGKGVYIYRLEVKSEEGETANKFAKMVILK